MILDDLNRFYEMKVSEPDSGIAPSGWSSEKVAWEFRIDREGRLVSILPLGDADKKNKFVPMLVPFHETRAYGIKPFFLCDKAAYFLGLDEKRGEKMLEASRELHRGLLESSDDAGAHAVLAFLGRADPLEGVSPENAEMLASGGLIVFRFLCDQSLIHERPAIRRLWEEACSVRYEGPFVQCAITGMRAEPAQLFPMVRGIPGAQSSGASLVSFNKESFCSYGRTSKDQALNASISSVAARNVGTALRYLSQSPSHHVLMGDTQVLFWTDDSEGAGLELLSLILSPDYLSKDSGEDETALADVKARLEGIRSGRDTHPVDTETKYFVLGLAPNAARLSVRSFFRGSLGDLEKRFQQYLADTEIVSWNGISSIPSRSIRTYAYQTAAFGKSENVPGVLLNAAAGAMLRGSAFPAALYQQLLSRTRTDKGFSGSGTSKYDAMSLRASMMKACLLRSARQRGDEALERSITVALNEENDNAGYLMGRLFAVLEKVQAEAVPGANATIRDRYIGAASATPARVFPQLLKMAQHHISKAEYGATSDRRLQEIMERLDSTEGFPPTLSYDDQGQFFIGYYQQKASFYAPKAAQAAETETATKENE